MCLQIGERSIYLGDGSRAEVDRTASCLMEDRSQRSREGRNVQSDRDQRTGRHEASGRLLLPESRSVPIIRSNPAVGLRSISGRCLVRELHHRAMTKWTKTLERSLSSARVNAQSPSSRRARLAHPGTGRPHGSSRPRSPTGSGSPRGTRRMSPAEAWKPGKSEVLHNRP